jgi:hypothetical protein
MFPRCRCSREGGIGSCGGFAGRKTRPGWGITPWALTKVFCLRHLYMAFRRRTFPVHSGGLDIPWVMQFEVGGPRYSAHLAGLMVNDSGSRYLST